MGAICEQGCVEREAPTDIGAAGAVLFGKQKFKASGTYEANFIIGTGIIDEKRSKNTIVPNLEGSAALSWLITDDAKFSLGYRVDSYFDVYDDGEVFVLGIAHAKTHRHQSRTRRPQLL